mmetsp:Transcript_48648/g.122751  ORF Transcript_48648/g.122751 Transcript_48648/m.122751 type:complete len:357 (+) Transcript_48648:76-1146(+)|eukprot:CAMPEP_0115252890 /NCGR_PEP_ID=MMETSP0270-20121206/44384_1 /TAXON_ID=71861 /ORGANISM="Scrippsiella trochoidea, Strain CCMP3099" /LENGTH=356 /DNA_ID=CAMNT_0002668367 /DNA_START=69 /DNA_END=1139 /DNA_ORIENTATION=-
MVASVAGPPSAAWGQPSDTPILPFIMVFGGCMSSIVFMEYVLKGDPEAGNFINATEFVFVLLQSIPGRLEPQTWRFRPLRATWLSHIQHAVLWVSMSTLANYVFAFNISVPIHTLFRSCNIIASLVLGFFFFGQRYSFRQIVFVLVITVGIFLASIGDAQKFLSGATCNDCAPGSSSNMSSEELGKWGVGIVMLVCVQLFQATLGHTQAVFYRRFQDKGSRDELADEYLFTSHIVSLLMILALWEDISRSARLAFATPVLHPLLPLPRRLAWMVLNNLTQLACIKGVFRLSANFSPLTVNVTLSVRKFLSVVLSAVWFGNPWTSLHSIATMMIFGGVFAYSSFGAPPAVKKSDKSD